MADEIKLSPSDLNLLVGNMRQISDELKTEREIREKERKEGISIARLHVPLTALLAIVGTLVTTGVVAGIFVTSTKAHMSNSYLHADEKETITKGGIAYMADVKAGLASAVSDLEAGQRRIGRAVRAARCTPDRHGMVTCSVPDPETLPLRP